MFKNSIIGAGGVGWGHMGSWPWGMGVVWVLFLLLVVGLIVWLVVYYAQRQQGGPPDTKGPLEILDERYARGELDREEYLEKRSDLEK